MWHAGSQEEIRCLLFTSVLRHCALFVFFRLCIKLLICVSLCVCMSVSGGSHICQRAWLWGELTGNFTIKKILKVYFLLIMKFFLDSDWCAIILSRPCSSCYGNQAVVMVSLFSPSLCYDALTRSAPNIAYRCYLLNFEKPLGKLRSWARFQAFLRRLGAHQVARLKSLLIIRVALRDVTV